MMNYKSAKIAEDANIAKQSVIIGDVTIGRDSCVLYYSVLRGDEAPIVIGEETNIQENCTVHVSRNMPVRIGNNVTVGHNAVIHSCTIGDRTLIGMGAVILDGARRRFDPYQNYFFPFFRPFFCIICEKYDHSGWLSGDGKSGKNQKKSYLGRKAWKP